MAGAGLCEPRSADFVAGVALCELSWQVQRLVNLEVQISWQAQHLVNLEVQISWQVQRLVTLDVQVS